MIEQIQDIELTTLNRLALLDNAAFGIGGLNAWHLAPLIRHGRVFVFWQDSEIAGSVQYMLDWDHPDTAYMVGITVDQRRRGQGIASKLLRESFHSLRQQNLRLIELTVAPDNVVALRLYETKLGFSRTGYRENEYGAGEHRLVLTLNLSRH
ncbi:acetyltransferase [Anaerosporomusa subterranea]|uniref:Acetyltransferase n=1 Tax=Anaerosporomusa subterranea TaxID=1794912 RepID=A0A154BV72_ANASB|nr:GNAT family N-acetyltransferase [Anaerosporomusa subterranea]KYZ77388.1 acetyltransferase [Anaerosporomusa subterranea]